MEGSSRREPTRQIYWLDFPREQGKDIAEALATPQPKPTDASQPEGLGLQDGQRWRLELDGPGEFGGPHVGGEVRAARKQDDLSLVFEGEGTSLFLTFEHTPIGQTGRFAATPARFSATTPSVNCSTAMGGSIWVDLTHNTIDHVAGRFEGKTECAHSEGAKVQWSGAFDYTGTIDRR